MLCAITAAEQAESYFESFFFHFRPIICFYRVRGIERKGGRERGGGEGEGESMFLRRICVIFSLTANVGETSLALSANAQLVWGIFASLRADEEKEKP